ncbi:MAG: HEPN domain-containing protein [Desulfotomaculales bacterium]
MLAETQEWVAQAEYDLETARAMYSAGRYIYTLFMCHLALEKILKAYVVERTTETPPKTHNLITLLRIGNPRLSKQHREFIAGIAAMGVTTRYPASLSRALKSYTKEVTREFLEQTEEVFACLKQGISAV